MFEFNNKIKILLFLLCVVVLVSTVNTTYARYSSAASGTVTTNLARWQLFVNSENIISNYGTSMTFVPVIIPNENVAANKIAPSSKGYFDIAINPENVDVSFMYDIAVNVPADSLITDIKVTDYAIVEGEEITEESVIEKNKLNGTSLKNVLLYDNSVTEFSFKPFVVRLFFAWVDDETSSMNDQTDSMVGNMIANGEDTKFQLGVSINFKQYLGEEDDELLNPEENTPEDENTEVTDPENTEPDPEEQN